MKFNSIKLQRASDKDVQDVLEIEKTTMDLETYHGLYDEREVLDYIKEEIVYLILKENILVGIISYKIRDKDCVYIGGLIVKPEFQKQGLGRQVMKKLLKELKDYTELDLVVHPDNIPAVKLYKSLGFIEKSRMENHYGDGEPRLLLVLTSPEVEL
jgi:[ribosomal protein S18]-alanine N-acetyltransferase